MQIHEKALIWHIYENAMQAHIEKIWGWDYAWQKQDFEKNIAQYTTSFILNGDKIIGYLQYKVKKKRVYINMLILEPLQQSQGIGGKVLNHLISEYKLDTVSLRCFKVNDRAFKFYLRLGFAVIAEDDNFYLLEKTL